MRVASLCIVLIGKRTLLQTFLLHAWDNDLIMNFLFLKKQLQISKFDHLFAIEQDSLLLLIWVTM